MDFPWLTEVTHAKPSVRLPTILNREEVRLSARLCAHLAAVKAQHEADLALNKGEVWLPDVLAVKYPNAPKEWDWQYIFPANGFSTEPSLS